MYKTSRNFTIVTAVFVVCLVLSNIIAAKVIQIGFVELPAAIIVYPLTYLCTDIIGEIWGKKSARFVINLGIIIQLLSIAIIYISIALPPAYYMTEFQETYTAALSSTARFVIASLIAYAVSQSFDIFAFHWVKDRWHPKWMRSNTTVVSQLIDTSIFITIAFIGVVPNIISMILSQYVVKVCIALADTPFFYYLTRHGQKTSPADSE